MPTRRGSWALFSVLALLLPLSLSASSELGGVWSGRYSLSGVSGDLRLTLAQIGAAVVARAEAAGFSEHAVIGSVDGAGACGFLVLNDGSAVQFRGHVDGDRLIVDLRAADGSLGSALLLREIRSDAATVDFTGTWSGTISGTKTCGNGQTIAQSADVTANLFQSGDTVSGIILAMAPQYDDQCRQTGVIPLSIPVAGTVSGATLSVSVVVLGSTGQLTATVNGSSMSVSLAVERSVLNGTLTRTSSQPPDSGLTGTYSGTVTLSITPCSKPPAVTYTVMLSGSLLQAGSAIGGFFTFTGDKSDKLDPSGNCILVDNPPQTNSLSGQISGSTIAGFFVDRRGNPIPFIATISGNTISGGGQDTFGGSFTFTLTRTSAGAVPAIVSFSANPSTILAGDSSTLSWSTFNAASVTLDNGIGLQTTSGRVRVSPQQTTTYTLTATNTAGAVTSSATVMVTGTGPRVVIGSSPSGMIQPAGAATATDTFTVSNLGSAPANITLSQNGGFFTLAPTSFSVGPRSSHDVAITATAQPPGAYGGTVTVNGDGVQPGGIVVAVRLLVAAPPTAPVRPQATVSRVDVSAVAGQNPSGSVSFTNSGTGTVQGIAVADVPWIIPQSDIITIPPGQTQQVTFTVDRSKRPDSSALSGGLTGTISLVYLTGGLSKGATVLGTTPSGSVSVTIVDVVKPGVSPGTPPPLQQSELALFVAGLGSGGGVTGDILLSSRSQSPISDLKLFLVSQSTSQLSNIPQLLSNAGLAYPSVASSVFGFPGTPTFQLRSADAGNVSVSAVRTVNPSGALAFSTAVPLFRSDRGTGAGARLLLPGVEKSSVSGTTLVLQELSGNPATADIQSYDSAGVPLGMKVSASIGPFGVFSDDGQTVREGARSVVITNTSSGSAKIDAYARVADSTTLDSWMVIDSAKLAPAPADTLVVPLFPSPVATAAQTDIFVTNGSSAPVSVGIEVTSGRHRSVRSTSDAARPHAPEAQTSIVKPLETTRTSINGASGYVRITAPAGAISASGRISIARGGGNGSFGSALPSMPASSAIAISESRRFTGVDDASAKSIAAATSATFRSSLALIEVAGQRATVHVTLRYTFVAGATVSAQAVSATDFTLSARQMILISDLARSIIGSQRDSFGDLRNMQVDVEVIDGAGKVLPFLEAIDNGSADIMVRSE